MAQPSVLIVEDHEDSRTAMADALERTGFDVVCAPDGRVALDVLHGQTPDVLVLDLMMPVFTGWELLRIIRADERLAAIPIVVVSAYYTPHRELGRVHFVPKPARMDAVLRAVCDSCARAPSDPPPPPTGHN